MAQPTGIISTGEGMRHYPLISLTFFFSQVEELEQIIAFINRVDGEVRFIDFGAFLLSAEYLDKKSPEEGIARHVEFYYLAPLLARSIFSRTASYLKNRQELDLVNKIVKKTRQLITQNGLSGLS